MEIIAADSIDLASLMRYMPRIADCFEQLVRRFPDDVTVEGLFMDFMKGNKKMWLVVENGTVLSVAMTQLKTNEATGCKTAIVMDMAGSKMDRFLNPLIERLEEWAREVGADWYAVEGRMSWTRLLRNRGYEPHAVLVRKKVE